MRATLIVLATCIVLGPTAAVAAYGPTLHPKLSASPNPVRFGQTLTVKGKEWPVIEFCRRTVRFRLTSAQNAVRLGKTRVRLNGSFTFRSKIKRSKVGAGHWTLRAKMNCESGKDNSPNPVRKSVAITIE